MGKIIAGMASSHAYALVEPTGWDVMRGRTRARYKARYGVEPEVHPNVASETPDVRERGYRPIREALEFFRRQMQETRPDALIIVGDDQDENFTEDNLPQIAVYTGAAIHTTERTGDGSRLRGPKYACHAALAGDLVSGLVEREFDVASCRSFPNDELLSHAHGPIMRRILPDVDVPVVPVFLNAIHVPAPSPGRCYRLGAAMREIIESRPGNDRVAVYASGGLSHFTAGYPWQHYTGRHGVGSISEEFDRGAVAFMKGGEGHRLEQLTSRELLDNGGIEMRSWITLLGAVGNVPPRFLHYQPFYSAVMAMGAGYWEPDGTDARTRRDEATARQPHENCGG